MSDPTRLAHNLSNGRLADHLIEIAALHPDDISRAWLRESAKRLRELYQPSWWPSHPVYIIRGEADIQRALAERRPYTVVYDTDRETS